MASVYKQSKFGIVLIYISETIPFSERNDLILNSLEMICIEIKKPHNKSFLVCAWYRPPNSSTNLFDDFETFLNSCDLENHELLIMGDLNCDISKFPLDFNARKLQLLSSLYQLNQLIDEPTRVTSTSATLIDLIFTNKKQNIMQTGVVHIGISDHSLIYVVRKFCLPKSRESTKYVRNFKNFDAEDFRRDISQIPWESVSSHDNPNVCWKIWQSHYLKVLDRHAPLRHIRIRANSLPWITQKIKEQMRSRDFHKKRAVKHNSEIHWSKYREIRNKLHQEMRLAKKSYFCDKIKICAQTRDLGKSWSLINNLLGKNTKKNNITELLIDDIPTSDDRLIAETMNEYFVTIGSKLASEIGCDLPDETNSDFNIPYSSQLFKFSEICEEEVITELRNLKTAKSTGVDSIPARVLKISADIIAPSLVEIFNLSLKTGIFVHEWKKAWVLPIYKSADRRKCGNYRPISILPVVSKIFERSVFNQLYKFLNDNSLLSKYQSGFRPKNSTLTALIQMCDKWYENLDNGKLTGVVFLDIRKAFDSVNHNILLHKMKTQFGFSNIELDWFQSYLTNREQVCHINGKCSSSKKIITGVPQGSILGPLLFLLYINDLPDCLCKTTPCLYADDTQIFASSFDYAELIDNLNYDLNHISEWLARNKLQHHHTKTKVMIIGSTYNLRNKVYDPKVILNGKLIPRTKSFECLGVHLDEKLAWDEHIDKICNKIGAGIAVMKRIKPFVPPNSLQMIYKAMIQPHFDYCSPLWDNCCLTLKDKLQKFQNRAARIIAGVNYEVNSADVLNSLGWETLEDRRIRNKSIFMFRILNGFTAPSLKESFTWVRVMQGNYNLRNSHTDLALPNPRREFLKRSFKYSGAKLWNCLSLEAKLAESEYAFKTNINRII